MLLTCHDMLCCMYLPTIVQMRTEPDRSRLPDRFKRPDEYGAAKSCNSIVSIAFVSGSDMLMSLCRAQDESLYVALSNVTQSDSTYVYLQKEAQFFDISASSTDGQFIAVANCLGNHVDVWRRCNSDASEWSWMCYRELKVADSAIVRGVHFSKDSDAVIVVMYNKQSHKTEMLMFSVLSGALVQCSKHLGATGERAGVTVCFSSDDSYVITASDWLPAVSVWSVRNRQDIDADSQVFVEHDFRLHGGSGELDLLRWTKDYPQVLLESKVKKVKSKFSVTESRSNGFLALLANNAPWVSSCFLDPDSSHPNAVKGKCWSPTVSLQEVLLHSPVLTS
jgi:hypothetical protein